MSSSSELPSCQRAVTTCTLASEKQRRCLNRREDVTAGSERKHSEALSELLTARLRMSLMCLWWEELTDDRDHYVFMCVCERECRPTTSHHVFPIRSMETHANCKLLPSSEFTRFVQWFQSVEPKLIHWSFIFVKKIKTQVFSGWLQFGSQPLPLCVGK